MTTTPKPGDLVAVGNGDLYTADRVYEKDGRTVVAMSRKEGRGVSHTAMDAEFVRVIPPTD